MENSLVLPRHHPVLCSSPGRGLSPPLLRAPARCSASSPSPPRYLVAAGTGLRSSDLREAGQWEAMLAGGSIGEERPRSAPPGEILWHHQEKSFSTTRRNPSAPPGEILWHHWEKNISTIRRNPLAPCHRHSFLCLNDNLELDLVKVMLFFRFFSVK